MTRPAKDNRFLIVTGLSGSGKTVVSRALEDFGYYCMDNLPAKLIPDFVDLWIRKQVEIDRVALVLDIREPRFLTDFPPVLKDIRKKVPARLVFLDATDEALVKSFNETRRPHPLSPAQAHPGRRPARAEAAPGHPPEDGRRGHRHVEPQHLPAEGGHRRALLRRKRSRRTQIVLISFGYKYGIPLDSGPRLRHALPAEPVLRRPPAGRGPARRRSVREFVLASPGTPAIPARALPLRRLRHARASPGGQEHPDHRRRLHRRQAPLGRHRRGAPGPPQEAGAATSRFITGTFINRRLFIQ